jgi:hypothetical protein
MARMIRLDSGRWYARLEQDAAGREYLHLSRAERPGETMRARLPFSWRMLDGDVMTDLARAPELRIWLDEHGIRWRIAAVGPGTDHDLPFPGRVLVFDSDQAWAGVTPYAAERELGDLTDSELRVLRDGISDLGGGRRRFRPPEDLTPNDVFPGQPPAGD